MTTEDQSIHSATDEEHAVGFSELFSLVRRNWWLLALLALAGGTAAVLYSHSRTKIFRATTTIQIDPSPPKPLGHAVEGAVDVGTTLFGNSQYYETQYQVLRSRNVALQTVQRLALHRDASFVFNVPDDDALSPAQRSAELTEAKALSALQARLAINPPKESRLVVLSFDDANPERAKRILRTLVDIYINNNIDNALASTNVAAEWLEDQLQKLRAELSGSELALHNFKREQQILSVSLDDQSNMLRREMEQLGAALTSVRAELEALRSRQTQLESLDTTNPTTVPARELLQNELLNRLRSGYIIASQEVESLLGSGKGSQHPSVVAARGNLEIAHQALVNEVANIREALRRDVQAKEAEEAGLARLLDRAKAQALELNRLGLEFHRLERAKTNTEKIYSLVLERVKESDLTRHMRFNNIRVIDSAFSDPNPISPRTRLNIALGGFAGLMFGLVLAFARYWLDRTFRTAEDIERRLQLPILGVLPRTDGSSERRSRRTRSGSAPSLGTELIVHEQPNSSVAEAARALRTNLMFSAPDAPQDVLVVTSGAPLEGKTTVACWIATALAQTGKRVLLLDCDLRRPRLHRVYGRSNDIGVSSAVIEALSLDDIDLSTVVPNLDVLPAGPHVPNPAELLQSERFEAFLDRIKQRYDRIVIDTPPVNAVTDAAILSAKGDGTILVVRAHRTPYDSAVQSVRTLEDVSTPIRGVVLNAFDQKRAGYRYGAYRYHHYYGSQEQVS